LGSVFITKQEIKGEAVLMIGSLKHNNAIVKSDFKDHYGQVLY